MPIDKELLEILCCPKTKVEVRQMEEKELKALNEKVRKGHIRYVNGEVVPEQLDDGLITKDQKTVYRVDDGIPVMLIDMGIPWEQVG